MKRKKTIITVAVALAVTLGVTTVTASAASLSELRDQISEKQSELEEGREHEESLSSQLNELEQAISENEDKLAVLEDELVQAEKEVETQTENLKAEIAASNEETEKMIDELQADADKLTQELASQGSSSSDSTYLGGQMAWPLPSVGLSNITSYFGYRIHPIYGYSKYHTGLDIGASSGSSIVAANGGTICDLNREMKRAG